MPFYSACLIDHRAAIKTRLFQPLSALVFFTIQVMRRPFWQADIQVAVRFDRVVNHLGAGVLVRSSPDAETKSTFRFQNATCLGTRHFGLRDVEQTEVNQ